jgi:hypothetical protein
MTTDVSSSPRVWSATGGGVLVKPPVDVGAELVGVDRGRSGEGRQRGIAGDVPSTTHGSQLADGHPVAGDAERFAGIERAHDLAAVVAQFPLGQISSHTL